MWGATLDLMASMKPEPLPLDSSMGYGWNGQYVVFQVKQ